MGGLSSPDAGSIRPSDRVRVIGLRLRNSPVFFREPTVKGCLRPEAAVLRQWASSGAAM